MHKLLLYEVGTEKKQSLNFSRQIPISWSNINYYLKNYICYRYCYYVKKL